jgi:hypothetical protein
MKAIMTQLEKDVARLMNLAAEQHEEACEELRAAVGIQLPLDVQESLLREYNWTLYDYTMAALVYSTVPTAVLSMLRAAVEFAKHPSLPGEIGEIPDTRERLDAMPAYFERAVIALTIFVRLMKAGDAPQPTTENGRKGAQEDAEAEIVIAPRPGFGQRGGNG